jgi:hypothetical protein
MPAGTEDGCDNLLNNVNGQRRAPGLDLDGYARVNVIPSDPTEDQRPNLAHDAAGSRCYCPVKVG